MTEDDKIKIQIGSEIFETNLWTLPLMAEAILRSTDDEVKLDIDQREILEVEENAAL